MGSCSRSPQLYISCTSLLSIPLGTNLFDITLIYSIYAFIILIGRGVPNHLERECNRVATISSQAVPTTDAAAQMYRSQGGTLTEFGIFGCDPLKDRADLIQRREVHFFSLHPTFKDLFSNAVSGDGGLFRAAITDFIRVTRSLQQLLQ